MTWISVEERMPRDHHEVWVAHTGGVIMGWWTSVRGPGHWQSKCAYLAGVTHWQEIIRPPAPESGQSEADRSLGQAVREMPRGRYLRHLECNVQEPGADWQCGENNFPKPWDVCAAAPLDALSMAKGVKP